MNIVVDENKVRQIIEDYFFDNNIEKGDSTDLSQSLIDSASEFTYCKDCKFYENPDVGIHLCSRHGRTIDSENYFCGDADRIED